MGDRHALDPDAIDAALRAGRIEPLLARAENAVGVAARRYATDVVGRALALADPGSVRAELRARARALGVEEAVVASSEDDAPPHAVRIPLVDRARSDDAGAFVRMVWIEFDPTGASPARPSLDARALGAVSGALARAAEIVAPPRDRDRFRLVAARPLAMERVAIEGESLAAGALVSAVSLWSERATRPRTTITGALTGNLVTRVGEIAAKVGAAIESGCDTMIVPAENDAEARAAGGAITIVAVRTVAELIEHALVAERAHVDPERAMRETRAAFAEGWRGYRWPSIAERLARVAGALPEGRPDLQVEVLAKLAAARRHLGDPEGSLHVIESASAIAEARSAASALPDGPLTSLERQRAMTELKLFRFAEASRAAKRATAIAKRARLRGEWIKALGCAGLVAMAQRRWEVARASFEDALEMTIAHAPGEAARSRVYLLDALGRLGREDEARHQWHAAMDEVERGDARARREKEAWVRTGWGGALVAMQRWSEAIDVLDTPAVHEALHDDPLPGLLARRHLGIALARAGRGAARERGLHLLASSPTAHGRALEPGLRSMAHVNVLVEAELRAVGEPWSADVAARTRVALASLPLYGAAPRWLGGASARLERAIASGRDAETLARALRALIERCETI